MRIALPIFGHGNELPRLALTEYHGSTLLGATLTAINKTSYSPAHVGSDNNEVLKEASRHGACVHHLPTPRRVERLLLPGSLDLMSRLGPTSETTALLWPCLAGINKAFLDHLTATPLTGSLQLALTVTQVKDHPCQLFEAAHFLAAAAYLPLVEEADRLISAPFPFHWNSDNLPDGTFFLRHDQNFLALGTDPSSWPQDGVLEWLPAGRARLVLSRQTNDSGDHITAAATADRRMAPLIRILQKKDGRWRLSLSVTALNNMLYKSALTAKLWILDSRGLTPLAPSGICLNPAKATDEIPGRNDTRLLFELPDVNLLPGQKLILWLMGEHESEGTANVAIPWESPLGGWRCDLHGHPILAKDGRPITGRQDFPPVFEFDGVAALLAPGLSSAIEPPVCFETAISVAPYPEPPQAIRHRLDLLRLGHTTNSAEHVHAPRQSGKLASPCAAFTSPAAQTWEDMRLFADVLGNTAQTCDEIENHTVIRSMAQACQVTGRALEQNEEQIPMPAAEHHLIELPGIPESFGLSQDLAQGMSPLFALPEPDGGAIISFSGRGRVVRFSSEGERMFSLDLNLELHNNAFHLCRSHLPGGVTLLLNHYHRIRNIDAQGRIVNDLPMPMPYMVAAHYDPASENYLACSGATGICAVFDSNWQEIRRFEQWPEPLGYKKAMRLFHDHRTNQIWVVLGAQAAEIPLSIAAYDMDGHFTGQIIHPPVAGLNAVSCIDTTGVFHICCKRCETVSFTNQGKVLTVPQLPTCCSLQPIDDRIWAITRYGLKLKVYRIAESSCA